MKTKIFNCHTCVVLQGNGNLIIEHDELLTVINKLETIAKGLETETTRQEVLYMEGKNGPKTILP